MASDSSGRGVGSGSGFSGRRAGDLSRTPVLGEGGQGAVSLSVAEDWGSQGPHVGTRVRLEEVSWRPRVGVEYVFPLALKD